MILRINGEEKNFSDDIATIGKLLDVLEINPQRTAVEINKKIVSPELFQQTRLHDSDTVEIVSFVGGG